MTEEHYSKLLRQSNYLGSTRNSIINLKLFLNKGKVLTEKEISESLKTIRSDKNEEIFYSNFPQYYNDLYKDKQRYLYSLDEYISALLHIHMDNAPDQWNEADERIEKKLRIYSINNEILDTFTDFADEVSLSQTTLINYAFMNGFHELEEDRAFNYSSQKKKKGFELTLPSISLLDDFSKTDKEMVMNRLLKKIPLALESTESS